MCVGTDCASGSQGSFLGRMGPWKSGPEEARQDSVLAFRENIMEQERSCVPLHPMTLNHLNSAIWGFLDFVKHLQTGACNSFCHTYSAGTEGPPSAGLSNFKCWEISYPRNQTSSVQTKSTVDVWMMRKGKAVFSSTLLSQQFWKCSRLLLFQPGDIQFVSILDQ